MGCNMVNQVSRVPRDHRWSSFFIDGIVDVILVTPLHMWFKLFIVCHVHGARTARCSCVFSTCILVLAQKYVSISSLTEYFVTPVKEAVFSSLPSLAWGVSINDFRSGAGMRNHVSGQAWNSFKLGQKLQTLQINHHTLARPRDIIWQLLRRDEQRIDIYSGERWRWLLTWPQDRSEWVIWWSITSSFLILAIPQSQIKIVGQFGPSASGCVSIIRWAQFAGYQRSGRKLGAVVRNQWWSWPLGADMEGFVHLKPGTLGVSTLYILFHLGYHTAYRYF